MILEGIVTTLGETGSLNIAPMGPLVDADLTQLVLRPYQTSTTFANLKHHGEGVFHITDDVLLLARAAVGELETPPPLESARRVRGQILSDACRVLEFRVVSLDARQDRSNIVCEVVERRTLRDFFGFNRAKHAVLEGAILATRLAFLPADEILKEYQRLAVIVEKTAGPQEHAAFTFLEEYVRARLTIAAANPAPVRDDSPQS